MDVRTKAKHNVFIYKLIFYSTQEGYGVIVLNTNYNRAEPEGALIKVSLYLEVKREKERGGMGESV